MAEPSRLRALAMPVFGAERCLWPLRSQDPFDRPTPFKRGLEEAGRSVEAKMQTCLVPVVA